MSRPLARWRSRIRRVGEQWTTWRHEWACERDLETALAGSRPIIAGPWLSEVGYEILYWAPFLRWVVAAYRVPPERLVVMSRGGTSSWYRGISSRYIEIFDYISPAEAAGRGAGRTRKQQDVSDLDRRLIADATRTLGADVNVLHPSLMFRWFAPFWSGHETLGFVERHSRHIRLDAPHVDLPLAVPDEYVAVKFYAARSLPDEPDVVAQLAAMVDGLSERYRIVHLDTGLAFDDHVDHRHGDRALSLGGRLEPRTNLAVQTRIIAGARMFVGTCGSLAWLAPLLGVPTVPIFADAGFLHAHLHVARRVYTRLQAGTFSPVDLSGLAAAGLSIGAAHAMPRA